MNTLHRLFFGTVIFAGGFLLAGGMSAVAAICYRAIYDDYVADATAVATILIGLAMTCVGKTRWDTLTNEIASDDR